MKAFTTEVVIAMGESPTILSDQRASIRVVDLGAGPFLAIEGQDAAPEGEGANNHCFYLQSEAEIDEFSAICKRILKEAEG